VADVIRVEDNSTNFGDFFAVTSDSGVWNGVTLPDPNPNPSLPVETQTENTAYLPSGGGSWTFDTAVPEPGSLMLLGGLAIGLLVRRRLPAPNPR
jgi:hypothetical protein